MHSTAYRFVVSTISALLLSAFAIECAGAATSDPEWLIMYDSPEFGDHEVKVSKHAIWVKNLRLGYEWLAKAPGWDIFVYSRKDKTICKTKLFDWKVIMPWHEVQEPLPVTKTGTLTWHGMNCTKYMSGLDTLYGANDIEVDAKAAQLFCKYYRTPILSQVPMIFFWKPVQETAYKPRSWLQIGTDVRSKTTYKFSMRSCKKIPYAASDFDPPVGYKTARVQSVVLSQDQRDQLDSALDSLGFSERSK